VKGARYWYYDQLSFYCNTGNYPFTVTLEIDVYYTSVIVFGESIETLQIDSYYGFIDVF
jgi:hypothetical protein